MGGRWTRLVAAGLVTAFVASGVALAVSRFWVLDYTTVVPLREILVKDTVKNSAEVKTYFLYEIANRTGKDRKLAGDINLYTDNGQVLHDTPDPRVKEMVENRREAAYVDASEMGRRIKNDETKKGVAIFGMVDREADRLIVAVQGITSIYKLLPGKDGGTVFKERTWVMVYDRRGDHLQDQDDDFLLVEEKWVDDLDVVLDELHIKTPYQQLSEDEAAARKREKEKGAEPAVPAPAPAKEATPEASKEVAPAPAPAE